MIRRRRPLPTSLWLEPGLIDEIRSCAAATDNETGGILIGTRSRNAILVTDTIEIPPAHPYPTDYTLRVDAANKALELYLSAVGPDHPLGYVGSWHSHPTSSQPSHTDNGTLKRDARAQSGAVALVVVARSAPGTDITATVSHGRTIRQIGITSDLHRALVPVRPRQRVRGTSPEGVGPHA